MNKKYIGIKGENMNKAMILFLFLMSLQVVAKAPYLVNVEDIMRAQDGVDSVDASFAFGDEPLNLWRERQHYKNGKPFFQRGLVKYIKGDYMTKCTFDISHHYSSNPRVLKSYDQKIIHETTAFTWRLYLLECDTRYIGEIEPVFQDNLRVENYFTEEPQLLINGEEQ